jgi:mRNA interferase MazF
MTTRSTTSFERGSVILVSVVFTDESGAKLRPAIVLTDAEYQQARGDIVIAPVTSRIRPQYGDVNIDDWRGAGLVRPSLAKAVLQTVHERNVARRLGGIATTDLARLQAMIRDVFGL